MKGILVIRLKEALTPDQLSCVRTGFSEHPIHKEYYVIIVSGQPVTKTEFEILKYPENE